jgi:hypothetical protein
MPAMPGLAVIVDFHISLNSIAGTLPDVLLQSTTLRSLLVSLALGREVIFFQVALFIRDDPYKVERLAGT